MHIRMWAGMETFYLIVLHTVVFTLAAVILLERAYLNLNKLQRDALISSRGRSITIQPVISLVKLTFTAEV